ncbi:sugar phosphate nucleotidyltransferase [uncultured Alistipes sp.]|uniref:nucleotidyltransferase family protein n=1 Tax=uncultured Alistipes sp. TaxID=538949 RepID=UPI0025DA5B42|nr:sugar phosphate nucleotidyltransferase [uncultured Alistipes sp.]
MVKPTLLVLAAGMGSRYGALKQMDGVGPNREAIIDYSIYDAIRAGFGKVVFVIRESFAAEFREVFSAERFGGRIEVEFVYQELGNLPEGFTVPEGREKPWGTNHALMMAAPVIHEPFAVINADDFYGADAYRVIGDYLSKLGESENDYCMVAYELSKTLSENGTVSRGVCTVSPEGLLESMVERTQIERIADGRIVYHDGGADEELAEDTPVSMNLFGFTPDYFAHAEEYFRTFLQEHGRELKSECYMPSVVNKLIHEGTSTLRVLRSSAQWFGVTYKADREPLVKRIHDLIASGAYPENLWK